MEQQIQDLEKRIKALEDVIMSANEASFNKVVVKDKIFSKGKGIKLTSQFNAIGCEIRTGNAGTAAAIINEVGTIPNGSIYLSSATFQPFWVKYNGTWTLVNLP